MGTRCTPCDLLRLRAETRTIVFRGSAASRRSRTHCTHMKPQFGRGVRTRGMRDADVIQRNQMKRSHQDTCVADSCITSLAVAPVAGRKVPPTPSTSSRRVAFAYFLTASNRSNGSAYLRTGGFLLSQAQTATCMGRLQGERKAATSTLRLAVQIAHLACASSESRARLLRKLCAHACTTCELMSRVCQHA